MTPSEPSLQGLDDIDRDGAIREAASRLPTTSRRGFLGAAVAGGVLAAVLARPAGARAAASSGDIAILNYALVLEYLQAAFYTEAEQSGALTGIAAEADRVIGAVERAHVSALRKALGSAAVKRPFFDFRGNTEQQDAFLRTAVAFEDLGTAAYKGQLARISDPALLAAAASIHTVEARHAAWIRYLAGVTPAAEALDPPFSMARTQQLVASTGFIVQRPRTNGRRPPRFTG
jgi:Ferritin-like domain